MTTEELRDMLTLRGRQVRVKKSEVVVHECWFCGNQHWNLELNVSLGVYKCWVCKEHGALSWLLREYLGVEVHIPVRWSKGGETRVLAQVDPLAHFQPAEEVVSCRQYLAVQRRLDLADIRRFDLRVDVKVGSQYFGRILVPLLEYWTQVRYGYAARSYVGDRPKYLNTTTARFISGFKTRGSKVHVLVEGPFDGIAVARSGFNASFLLGSSSDDIDEWAARVPPSHEIVILMDGDALLQARKLVSRVLPIRPTAKAFVLPTRFDPGKLLPGAVTKIIAAAGPAANLLWAH